MQETWENKCKRIVAYHNGQAIELLKCYHMGSINIDTLSKRTYEELRIATRYQEKLDVSV